MKKMIKILLILLFVSISFFITSEVEAASASINPSKTTATVGDNVTITITFNAAAWNLKVSGTGISSKSYVDNTDDAENAKITKSLKLDTSTSGTKTIKLTGDVTDGTTGVTTQINKSVTITVTNSTSSNGNSSNSNSNNNNSNSNNNSNNNSNSNSNNSNSTTNSTSPTEPTFTSVNETVYATSKANVRSSYSTSSSIIGSLKIGDSVTRTGIGSNGWSKISYNGQTAYVSTSLISKTKPEENNEENQTSDDETNHEQNNFKLDSLKIKNYDLKPEFSNDVYNYQLNVESDIEKLDIEAISNDEDVIIEISGNENFVEGENVVNITISKDGIDEKVVYTINVIKTEQTETTAVIINQDLLNEEIDKTNNNLKIRAWTIRGIIIFVTVLIIIMIVLRYLTVRKENSEDFDYVNIREKFNEMNNLENKEEQTNQQEEINEEIEDSNDNVEYTVKKSNKSKGKHF